MDELTAAFAELMLEKIHYLCLLLAQLEIQLLNLILITTF